MASRSDLPHRAVRSLDLAGQVELGQNGFEGDPRFEEHHRRIAPQLAQARGDGLLDEKIDERFLTTGHFHASAVQGAERARDAEGDGPRAAGCISLDSYKCDET